MAVFEVIVKNDSVIPDCIKVGEPIEITVTGDLIDTNYPETVNLSVVNVSTGEEIHTDSVVVNDDTELNAVAFSFTVSDAGTYTATITFDVCTDTQAIEFNVCDPFGLVKDSCYNWHLNRPLTTLYPIFNVKVSEFEGDLISEELWDVTADPTYSISLEKDAIYEVIMEDPDTGDTVYEFVLWENCSLFECFRLVGLDIFCNDDDPCCRECNEDRDTEIEERINLMNKLYAIGLPYIQMAESDRIENVTVYSIDQSRRDKLSSAAELNTKLNSLLKDCPGNCNGVVDDTTSSTSGCSSC